jgi:uncharacterized protein (AIM24 family)
VKLNDKQTKEDRKARKQGEITPAYAGGGGTYGNAQAGFVAQDSGRTYLYYQSLSKPLNSPFHENLHVLESWTDEHETKVSIEEYVVLRGSVQDWEQAHYRGIAGHYAKRVHIELTGNGEVKIEPGAVHYMKGKSIQLDAKVTANSMIQGVKPKIKGVGHLWLEPTYNYYIKYMLDGEIMLESGWFAASQSQEIESKPKIQSMKGSVVGDAGLLHTKMTGKGWLLFRSPVPECEIQKVFLDNEKLTVDHFRSVIFYSRSLKFSAEYAGKGLFQKAFNTTKEGVFRTYTGTGEVWILPTLIIYEQMMRENALELAQLQQRPDRK